MPIETHIIMKNIRTILLLAGFGAILAVMSSCHKEKIDSPIVNHWGLEMYVRWETDGNGTITYCDTVYYEPVSGKGYEIEFESDGTGWLRLNESPAVIKKFNLTYDIYPDSMKVLLHSSKWLYALYGHLYMEKNEVSFDLDELNENRVTAWWKNEVSEPEPFYERFFFVPIKEE